MTTVKDGLKKYCDAKYSHSEINLMWVLKHSNFWIILIVNHLHQLIALKHTFFLP